MAPVPLPEAVKVILARQAPPPGDVVVLSGGAIAGIVIGSIVGFLLICWIIRACMNWGRPREWGTTFEPGYEKPHGHHRRSHPYHHETHRSRSRHSHHSHRSPRRSLEVRDVYYTRQQRLPSRGRIPQPPPETHARDARKARRSSRYA